VYPHFLAHAACSGALCPTGLLCVRVQTGIQTNFRMTNTNLGAELASFVAAYGTHYREPTRPGGQCLLSADAQHRRQLCTAAV
jgi:hypothetical protein